MNVSSVASPDARAAAPGSNAREHALQCATELERHLAQHHQDIAAFIVEPLIQCAGSMAMYDAVYLGEARRLCDHYGVHLIADEIAVGFGRTGTFFACEQAGITPDFLCLSKGLSGGYLPLSVVMTTDEIYGAFYADDVTRGFLHSHSYTGNALACSAALATLDLFEENDVIARNRNLAGKFARACAPLASHPRVKHFRQCGMVLAFDVETDDRQFARRFADMAARKELLLRPMGNTVYFMTPYIISENEIDLLASRTLELLEALS